MIPVTPRLEDCVTLPKVGRLVAAHADSREEKGPAHGRGSQGHGTLPGGEGSLGKARKTREKRGYQADMPHTRYPLKTRPMKSCGSATMPPCNCPKRHRFSSPFTYRRLQHAETGQPSIA